jgi:hypothetical protein
VKSPADGCWRVVQGDEWRQYGSRAVPRRASCVDRHDERPRTGDV